MSDLYKIDPLTFQKAAVAVIESISNAKEKHINFISKKELVERFGENMTDVFWNSIQNGKKKLPAKYHPAIEKILTEEYNVNSKYLRTRTGPMFSISSNELNEEAALYNTSPEKVKKLNEEIAQLKRENKMLQQLVKTQEQLIKGNEESAGSSINTSKTKTITSGKA